MNEREFTKYLPIKAGDFPKKSAMTPIGALTFGVLSVCVIGSVVTYPSLLSWALFGLGAITVLVALWAIQFFVRYDPDRLQTEDYRIQKEMVARIELPRNYSEQQIPPSDAALISSNQRVIGNE